MKAPASALVVDAAILIAAARGRSSGAILAAARAAALVTTDRAVAEARRRIDLGLKRPELHPIVDALIAEMTVVPVAALSALLPQAEIALTDAVASRNGFPGTHAYFPFFVRFAQSPKAPCDDRGICTRGRPRKGGHAGGAP